MRSSKKTKTELRLSGLLFIVSGVVLVVLLIWFVVLLFNLLPDELPFGGREKIGGVSTKLIFTFLFLFLTGVLFTRSKILKRLNAKPLALNISLLLIVLFLPTILLEISLAPFVGFHQRTSIFQQDNQRIWKLKPNSSGRWGGVPVKINSEGLRGEVIPKQRVNDNLRLLFLGDSVTFGYLLEHDQSTIPSKVKSFLEQEIGDSIEAINAGIGGYSPWQSRLFLEEEGLDYHPDIIILTIVLNDFTQKFSLDRFGGFWKGYQLAMNSQYFFSRMENHSNLLTWLRRKAQQKSYGFNPVERAEELEYGMLQEIVDAVPSDRANEAINLTLSEIEKISDMCTMNNIEFLLVFYPAVFQVEEPELLNRPQKLVDKFATEKQIPYLDLLPHFTVKISQMGFQPTQIYLDDTHPNSLANGIAAETISNRILKMISDSLQTNSP
ncbi:SGNH/GDSL hydrolase family protein [bacterium]|nr:SGNH/GDSL hydrolase family protein [bacterium]